MTIEQLDLQLLFLCGNVLLLAAVGIALVRFQRQCRRLETFWNSPTGDALANQPSAADTSMLQSNERVEDKLKELQRTVTLMEVKSKATTVEEKYLPIDNALRMAKSGASASDLQKACGLNLGEAKLMMKLHGRATPTECAAV